MDQNFRNLLNILDILLYTKSTKATKSCLCFALKPFRCEISLKDIDKYQFRTDFLEFRKIKSYQYAEKSLEVWKHVTLHLQNKSYDLVFPTETSVTDFLTTMSWAINKIHP